MKKLKKLTLNRFKIVTLNDKKTIIGGTAEETGHTDTTIDLGGGAPKCKQNSKVWEH